MVSILSRPQCVNLPYSRCTFCILFLLTHCRKWMVLSSWHKFSVANGTLYPGIIKVWNFAKCMYIKHRAVLFTLHIERNKLHIWGLDYTLHIKSCRLHILVYPKYTFYFHRIQYFGEKAGHQAKNDYKFLTSRCTFFNFLNEIAISNMNDSPKLLFVIYFLQCF